MFKDLEKLKKEKKAGVTKQGKQSTMGDQIEAVVYADGLQ